MCNFMYIYLRHRVSIHVNNEQLIFPNFCQKIGCLTTQQRSQRESSRPHPGLLDLKIVQGSNGYNEYVLDVKFLMTELFCCCLLQDLHEYQVKNSRIINRRIVLTFTLFVSDYYFSPQDFPFFFPQCLVTKDKC